MPGIDRGRRRSRRPQPHAGVLVTASYQTAPHSLRPCLTRGRVQSCASPSIWTKCSPALRERGSSAD
jgi:hypothetical protein